MKFRDIFLTASASLSRSKLRTALTIIAIFIGAFTLTLTNGLGAGISSYINKQVDNLGQNNVLTITVKSTSSGTGSSNAPKKYQPGQVTSASSRPGSSSALLTTSDINALKGDTDLTNVQPAYSISPDYIEGSNGQKYQVSASNVGGSAKLDLAAGTELPANSSENQLVLPASYVSSLGYSSNADAVGQTVTLAVTDANGKQHTEQASIIGVQQKGLVGSSGAVFNQTLTDNLYNLQSEGLPAASKDKYQSASADIVGSLSSSHITAVKNHLSSLGYSGETVSDTLGTFKTVISAVSGVLDAFAVIALLAASFGIVNTLLMSVQERTKEIGLMKAMGMRSSRIFLLFSIEAVLIGFWGSAIGVGIAELIGRLANHIVSTSILKNLPGFSLLSFPLHSVVAIMVLIMAIAFVAGTLPARKAAKQNPIDALRYE
jgi:putative ABC transport system permease protein